MGGREREGREGREGRREAGREGGRGGERERERETNKDRSYTLQRRRHAAWPSGEEYAFTAGAVIGLNDVSTIGFGLATFTQGGLLERSIIDRKVERLWVEIVPIGQHLTQTIEVARQFTFVGNFLHAGEVIDFLVALQPHTSFLSDTHIRPEKIPLCFMCSYLPP